MSDITESYVGTAEQWIAALCEEVRELRRLDLNLRRIVAELAAASSVYQSRIVSFRYRNHAGIVSIRRAKFGELAYDTTPWHGEAWTVTGWDYDKKAKRTFAVADILEFLDQEAQP